MADFGRRMTPPSKHSRKRLENWSWSQSALRAVDGSFLKDGPWLQTVTGLAFCSSNWTLKKIKKSCSLNNWSVRKPGGWDPASNGRVQTEFHDWIGRVVTWMRLGWLKRLEIVIWRIISYHPLVVCGQLRIEFQLMEASRIQSPIWTSVDRTEAQSGLAETGLGSVCSFTNKLRMPSGNRNRASIHLTNAVSNHLWIFWCD